MKGAVAGDIIGSIYERVPIKTKEFPLFDRRCTYTDDTVLTVAIAEAILTGRSYRDAVLAFGRRYPLAGYGGTFIGWLQQTDPQPYNSWGNGSAMRVSPIGVAFPTAEQVLHEAAQSAIISHDHPEGVKGAQAAALAVFLARRGEGKAAIRTEIAERFGYDLSQTVDEIRPAYCFDVSCQGTVPAALIAFLDSDSYEDAVRNAISLGGDSDTLACIAGAVAEAFYGEVPASIWSQAVEILPAELQTVLTAFYEKFGW